RRSAPGRWWRLRCCPPESLRRDGTCAIRPAPSLPPPSGRPPASGSAPPPPRDRHPHVLRDGGRLALFDPIGRPTLARRPWRGRRGSRRPPDSVPHKGYHHKGSPHERGGLRERPI